MLAGEAVAVGCLVFALMQTDALHFVGLRQIFEAEAPGRLSTAGFYGLVRHPLYLFGLLMLWLTPIMTLNLLTVNVLLTAYVFVGAWLEERRLQQEFGAAYRDYRIRTPMLIPRPWSWSRRGDGRGGAASGPASGDDRGESGPRGQH
jgi:protein-S-isoprenylcysteine O-methyltransferase Ste14